MGRYVETTYDGDGAVATSALVPSLMSEQLTAQLVADDPTATTIDPTRLEQFVTDAEAEVDSYLGVRYALPLDAVPAVIVGIAARITRYRLYTSRAGEIEDWLTRGYAADVAMLKDIRDGKLALGLTLAGADAAVSPTPGRRVRASSRKPKFGRKNFEVF